MNHSRKIPVNFLFLMLLTITTQVLAKVEEGISSFTIENNTQYTLRAQLKKCNHVLGTKTIPPNRGQSWETVKEKYSTNEYLDVSDEFELMYTTEKLPLKCGESRSDRLTLELFLVESLDVQEKLIAKLQTKHVYELVTEQMAPRICSYNDIHTFVEEHFFVRNTSKFAFKHQVGPKSDYCYSIGFHHISVEPVG